MSAPRDRINPRTHSVGIDQRLVTVMDLPAGQNLAICADRQGTEVRVPLYWQRAKGALPQAGESWLLSQDSGRWIFSLYLGTSAQGFPALAGPWIPMVLGAPWAAVAGYHAPSYRMTSSGDVQTAGRITGPTGTTVTTLPAAFFSSSVAIAVPCAVSASTQAFSANQVPRLHLQSSGALIITGFSAPATVTADLDAIFAVSAGQAIAQGRREGRRA